MPDFPFKRAEAGQPLEIAARDWNAITDATREFQRYRRGRTDSPPGQPPRVDPQRPATYAIVKWESATALAEFAVVTYGTPVILPDDTPKAFEVSDFPVFVGTTPAATTDPVMILTEPVAQNAYGRAVTSGVAVVDINVTDAAHTHATATAGDNTKLTSAAETGQARILYKPAGTGTLRCVVMLGGAGSGDSCCGWKADYWTDEWFPATGGGFYSVHYVEAAGGVENEQWVVDETELNFDNTGIVDAVVRASISASWKWDAIDSLDTNNYLIQVFAYLVSLDGGTTFLSGPVPVLFGQSFVAGGTRFYTGDLGMYSRTAGEQIKTFWGQGQATLRFGGPTPFTDPIPSRIAWLMDVYTSRAIPGANGIPGTLIVQGIGDGPTNITIEKLCCQTADGSGSGSGSGGGGCCEIDGDIEATIPGDVPGAGGATSATFSQASADVWTWNSAGGDAAAKIWTLTCEDGVYTLADFNGNSAENTEELDCEAFALAFDATEFGGTGEITMVLA